MKNPARPRFFLAHAAASALALLAFAGTAHAQTTYYWDNNGSTAGFGTATGTWAAPTTNNSTQGWSTDSTGATLPSGTTTTSTSDALNFGTASAGLAAGTITVSGTVNANSLTFGSASGNITLSGGTITLGGTTPTITVNNTTDTISSVLAGSAGLTKNGTGNLTLTGANTYTGTTTINAGTLQIGNNSTAGSIASTTIVNNANLVYLVNGAGENSLIASLPSSLSGNGNLTLSSTTGYYNLTGNISQGNINITTQAGSVYSGLRTNGADRTLTASTITINGIISDIAGTRTLTLDTSAANGAITLDVQTGASSRTYGLNLIANAGTGNITWSGNNAATAWSTATTLIGAFNVSSSFTPASLTLNATGNSSLSGNITLGTNSANTWNVNSGLTLTASGVLAGSNASITKNGNGILTLSGNNTYNGTTTINAGTLQTTSTGLLGGGSYATNITNSGTLIMGSDSNQILGGVISGTGALTKNGSGTLTLSNAANTYNGSTTVNAGTLVVSGNISSSAITLNSGGVISPSTAAAVTKFNAASLTINGGSGYAFTITNVGTSTAGTDYDQIALSGGLTFNNTAANPFNIYLNGTPTSWSNTGNYSWNIISAASQSGFNSGNFSLNFASFGIASANRTGVWAFTNPSGGNITLTYTAASADSVWSGGAGSWSSGFSPSVSTDKNITFTGSGGGTATNDIASGTLSSVNFITFNSTAGAYTLAANAGSAGASGGTALTVKGDIINNSASTQTINMALALGGASTGVVNTASGNITLGGVVSGVGGITKQGNSTLTLSGSNTYAAGTTLSAGTLNINNATALGSGTFTIAGGVLNNTSGSAITLSNNNAQNWNGDFAFTGTGDLNLGTGAVAMNASRTLTVNGGNLTVGGAVSGAGFALTKNGTGTLILSGSNTYSGGTTVNAGTLTLAGSSTGGGAVSVDGATMNIQGNLTLGSGQFTVGNAGAGVVNHSSGTVSITSGNGLIVGAGATSSSNGTYNLSGGVLNITPGANRGITLGWGSNSRATLNMSGGTLVNTGTLQIGQTTDIDTVGQLPVYSQTGGDATHGTLTMGGSGTYRVHTTTTTLSITGGNFTAGNFTVLASGTSNVANITIGGNAIVTLPAFPTSRGGSATAYLTFDGGTLRPTASSAAYLGGLTSATIRSGGITFDTIGYNITVSQALLANATSTGGGLTKNGTGTLTLSGSNTYTGATTINAGTLQIGAGSTTGSISTSSAITNNATLAFNRSDTLTQGTDFASVISGTGNVLQAGTGTTALNGSNTYTGATTVNAGTLILSGANTYTGATTINAGTLQIGAGGTTGSISSSASITNNGTLVFNRSDTLTQGTDFANSITGSGNLTKSGSGTMILGTNTYSGATTVNGGTLQLTGNISSSALTLASTGVVSIGTTAAVAKYNASSITLQGGSGYAFTIGNVNASVAGTDYDQLTATGALTLSNTAANPFTVYLNGTPTGWSNSGSYSWNIISAASMSGFSSGNFAVNLTGFGISAANRTGTWTFSNSATNITLTYAAATPDYIWSGSSGNWSTGFTPTAPVTDKNLVFTGSTGTATNDIGNGTLSSINFITFNSTAGAYTLAANAGSAGASGGTALTVKGDIVNDSSSTQTINMNMAFGSSSSGGIDTNAGNITISGVISGTGALNKSGNNTLLLTGNNTYTGVTTITAGTLQVGTGGSLASTSVVNNANLIYGTTVSSGTYALANSTTGTGNLTGTAKLLQLKGNITQSGNVSLTGSTATGLYTSGIELVSDTTITAGNITIVGDIGYRGTTAGNLNLNTSATNGAINLDLSIGRSQVWYGLSTLTANAGTGNLTVSGANAGSNWAVGSGVTLTGALNISSSFSASASAVNLNATGNSSVTGNLGLGATTNTLTVNPSQTMTVSGILSGASAAITKNGTGTLILSGNNTYTGATTINAGTIEIASTGRLGGGSYAGAITNNATLIYSGTNNQTLSGVISGTGALTHNASSTLTLSNTNTYTGGTTVNAGTLSLATAAANGTIRGNLTINTGARVDANATNWSLGYGGTQNYIGNSVSAITINGGTLNFTDTTSDGGIVAATTVLNGGTISSAGTFAFLSTLTYNQTVQSLASASRSTIASGIGLRMNFSPSIGNLIFDVASGTTSDGIDLQVNGGIINATTQGGGNIVKSGSGKLLLAGNNTYTGTTTINAGTIEIGAAGRLGGGSYAGAITNNGTLVYSGTNSQTLSGAITGTGALTQNAASTLTLSSASTNYNGTTTINTGTLAISNNMSIGAIAGTGGNLSLGSGFTLTTNASTNSTLSSIVQGSGNLAKSGTGTLTLSGNNTYNGTTTINAGTIQIGHANGMGASGNISFSGGGLQYGSGITTDLSSRIKNSGSAILIDTNSNNVTFASAVDSTNTLGLTKNGTGILTLNATNTYTGTTTVNAGTLQIGSAGLLGSGNYSGNIANSGSFVFGSNSNQTLSGNISGTGSLTKSGTGVLTLTGTSSFNGATTINSGTLVVNGSAANSAVTIGNTGVLGGNGTVGALTVQSGGRVGPGNSPGNLNVSTLTLEGGGGYNWEIANVSGTAGTDWDFITVGGGTGAATINATSGNKFTIYISGNPVGWNTNNSSSWNIIDWGNVTNFDANAFAVDTTGFTGTAPVGTWALSNTGGFLNLAYVAVTEPIWSGASGNWSTGFSPSLNSGNKTIYFAGAVGGNSTNDIASGTVGSVASLTFNSTAGAYTLAANSGSAGYDTASALQLNGNIVNNSTATQTINLALTSNATRVYDAAAGNLTMGGVISGTGGLTKNGSNLLTLSANNTYTGDTTINAGTVQSTTTGLLGGGNYSGNITNNGALVLGSNSNQTLGGVISGTGALTKNGTGTLTLTGSNNYSGGTTLNAGTLVIGNTAAAGTGTITQSSGSSLLKIDTTGTITNAMSVYNVQASQSATLSGPITANNATWDVDAGDTLTISGNISGTGGTTKNGTGTLVLSGNNSNTGATTVNSGTLTAASTKSLGATSGVVVNNGGSILVTASDAINDSANVTLNGGTLAVDGTFNESVGLLTLSANSVINLDGYAGTLRFSGVGSWAAGAILSIWNWNGINQYGTPVGDGADTRHVVFTDATGLGSYLNRISFYSGSGTGFAGTAFEQGFSGPGGGTEIRVVPEPGTYITAAILLAFSVGFLWNQQRKKAEAKRRKFV